MALHSSRSTPNTTRRNSGAVALYRCTVARGAPASDWTVRSISSSRAWVSTEICTSPGMRSPSMRAADEVKVGLAGGREADLDLLVAHPHQQVEHGALAGRAHRVDQRLVAVPQVGGQPAGRRGDGLAGPGPVGQVDGRERGVAMAGHAAGLLMYGLVRGWHRGSRSLADRAGASGRTKTPRRGSRPLWGPAAATKQEQSAKHRCRHYQTSPRATRRARPAPPVTPAPGWP